MFVVRLWDGFDGIWMDVSKPVTKEEADRIWNEKTNNGTERKCFNDIDYYSIFPADTTMLWTSGHSLMGMEDRDRPDREDDVRTDESGR
jgi:hypothetical protein